MRHMNLIMEEAIRRGFGFRPSEDDLTDKGNSKMEQGLALAHAANTPAGHA